MKRIDVGIGQVKSAFEDGLLETHAIGSCIAITAYDGRLRHGAMTHIMLPGSAPEGKNADERMRYAGDAIDALIGKMDDGGSKREEIVVVVAGGGNVLQKHDDRICQANIKSVLDILRRFGVEIAASSLGGIQRRSLSLDVKDGAVYCIEGGGSGQLLWKK